MYILTLKTLKGFDVKADLHLHSIYSHDAISKPHSVLAAAADRGIGIIAITDHDTTAGWADFKNLEHQFPVQIVYGQEIKIYYQGRCTGEILGLFLEKPIISHDLPEVLQEIRQQNGIASIAHPFSERRNEFLAWTEIDSWDKLAIESRNARTYNKRENEMAAGLAERLSAPITAGSDAHTPFEVGNVYLEFSGKSVNDLKKAILNRDAKAGGQPSSALFSVISGFGRLGIAV